ncbi:disease resistance protein Pik-1-like [Ricinus communis]|uniref:disease resistance protein Pik-1-like n=1 Tax=Ricinus communis TaxID=3988 RepID=UPI00201AEBDF|nr:disease resistance protein Pik-1-like [Ricinus communis]
MKQKLVIKISMNDQKSRSKALKIIVGFSGIESAALGEEDKSKIVVIGDGVDSVKLTSILRKKLTKRSTIACLLPKRGGHVELISVSAAEQKKEENKDETKVVWSYGCNMPQYVLYRDYF